MFINIDVNLPSKIKNKFNYKSSFLIDVDWAIDKQWNAILAVCMNYAPELLQSQIFY